jgi:CheY-like chemotaxis protein
VEKGCALISQLLAFSRRQMLSPEVSRLDRLVGEFCGLVQRTLGETISVDWRGNKDLWPCKIDPAQFQAALLNLAVNARDAMPRGGRLTIAAENTVLHAAEEGAGLSPGRYVAIAVGDSGSGMSPDVAARAFEPFFTTKEPGKGTGLGLSQVYGFVRQSGGDVTLESREGAGTTVTMMFPACGEAPSDALHTREMPVEPVSNAATILVAEDDVNVLEIIRGALTEAGHRVLFARDGHEALSLIERESGIAFLLTDVVMPNGLSGVDLATEALRRRQDLRVLLISGYPRDELSRQGGIGPFELLPKPFDTRSLVAKVNLLLSRPAPSPAKSGNEPAGPAPRDDHRIEGDELP